MPTPKPGSRADPIIIRWVTKTSRSSPHARSASEERLQVAATIVQKMTWLLTVTAHHAVAGVDASSGMFSTETGTNAPNHAVARYSRYGRRPGMYDRAARPE